MPLVTPPDDVVDLARALHDRRALEQFWRSVMPLAEAAAALRCPEGAVMARIEAGELIGLCVDGRKWLVSRRRVKKLADLDASKRH
jgi:hypothetical protein